ncbi:hypothetical protein ACIOG7_33445 [Streptomyces sp. NPDC087894]|uniref:hypothetical protein n=1 Tax=Streptomyces sp. NPDC087894 TaxID=3365816 RepID=UPI0038264ABF
MRSRTGGASRWPCEEAQQTEGGEPWGSWTARSPPSREWGEAHVRRFVEEGVTADLDVASGEKLAVALGGDALFVELDVTDTSGWEALVQQTKAAFGHRRRPGQQRRDG